MTSKAEAALQTVKRVLDEAPDHVVAELWVNDQMTLGAFVDMSLADTAGDVFETLPHISLREFGEAGVAERKQILQRTLGELTKPAGG